MSEEKAKIKLKEEYKKPREITVGTKTIKAKPGEIIEIDLADLDLWLKTGRFEQVDELPVELSPVELLVKNNSKEVLLQRAKELNVADNDRLTKIELAELIVQAEGGQQ